MKKEKPKRYRSQRPAASSIEAAEIVDPPKRKGPAALVPYQFKPGQSGNPKGARPGLANEIKSLTGGGVEMAHVLIRIMRGERIDGIWGVPTYKDVRESAIWLSEQCFGKAPLKISGDGETHDLQRLLYIELTRRKDDPGVFDVPNRELLEQGLEDQQPLPNQDQE